MRPVSPALTFAGVLVTVAGFVVILVTWGKVAALTAVPLQMPYLLSGGLTGLGLILSGLTMISVNAKRIDASARARQLGQLREVMAEIKSLLEEPAADGAPPATSAAETPEDQTDQLPRVNIS